MRIHAQILNLLAEFDTLMFVMVRKAKSIDWWGIEILVSAIVGSVVKKNLGSGVKT